MNFWMSDIGYWIKVYSDIRYNVRFRSLQSDIGISDIKLSPISLITDIGVSAHLWLYIHNFSAAHRLHIFQIKTMCNICAAAKIWFIFENPGYPQAGYRTVKFHFLILKYNFSSNNDL